MDPLTGLAAAQALQGVTRATEALVEAPETSGDSDGSEESGGSTFDALMRSMLPPGQVDEESLYAALLHERIQSVKGDEAAAQFQQALQEQKSARARSDGYVPVEDAANAALADVVAAGALTQAEASTIKGEAFTAAQLDDNTEALYDGRGSENDPTIAVADMESALLAARATLDKIGNGEVSADVEEGATEESAEDSVEVPEADNTVNNEDATSEDGGNRVADAVDGQGGFVFKPESEHGQKLVVLLPPDLANEVVGLVLKDADGNTVEEGRSSGFANGGREHFRFSKAGSEYPPNLTVEVELNNGETVTYNIPDPSQRYD